MLVLGWISESITSAGIWIVSGIYHVVAFVFEIFLILSTGELVSQESYKGLIQNFYVIIGVVMLFILAFSMLKGIVNPDDNKQGGSAVKKIITNLITSALIMAVLPTIFGFMYDFQNSFIRDYNVIGKFFGYGNQGSTNDDPGSKDNVDKVKTGAYQIVNGVWTAFFNVNMEECSSGDIASCQNQIESEDDRNFGEFDTGDENCINKKCNHTFAETVNYVNETGSFGVYGAFAKNIDESEVDFNFLLSLIGGLLLLYVVVSYCFDMALRLVKLIFYQIIAPIPIFMRVIPEGKLNGMFNQWLKITFACYFEVYTRIFIFYFCIYLCNKMIDAPFLSSKVFEYGFLQGMLAKAFVLMGVITFMRQAPKLLSEITGIDTGKMKLGIKDKLAAGGVFTAGAVLGGGITSAVRNATNGGGFRSVVAGGLSGAARAGKAGWSAKSFKDMSGAASRGATEAVNARDKRSNYKAAHGGTFGAMVGHVKDFGKSVKNYAMDESIEGLTRESANMGKLASKYGSFSDGIEGLLEKEQQKGGGSVFLGNGFSLANYSAFDTAAQDLATAKSNFNLGRITAAQLRTAEGNYIAARDAVRDELMDIALEGSKGATFTSLSAKGQAALKDSLVNAQSLQATIVENADSSVVQSIMGAAGNDTLKDIVAGKPIKSTAFAHGGTKLKDAAKVAQGQADIKIAEMNKEQAAKGDKK